MSQKISHILNASNSQLPQKWAVFGQPGHFMKSLLGVSCHPRGDGGCVTNIPDNRLEPPHRSDRQVSSVQDRQCHIQDDIHPPQHDGQ